MITVRVLGELQVELDDDVVPVTSARQRAVLAVLAMHIGQGLQSERILDLVWGDDQPANGLSSLRFHINKLRNIIEPDRPKGSAGNILVTTAAGYMLDREHCSVDTDRFEALLDRARELQGTNPVAATETATEALSHWRGDEPYPEFRYAEFAQEEIGRLNELRLQAYEVKLQGVIDAGRGADAVAELERLAEQHPYRERFVGLLMQALYASGRQVDALRRYEQTRTRFIDELGIDLTPELRSTELRILEQDPDLVREQRSRPVGNVPVRLSALIGRDEARADIAEAVMERRLVTLVGLGGVGKTSLATEVALDLADSVAAGAWFIDLSGVRDADRVPTVVRLAIEGLAAPRDDTVAALTQALRTTSALLVLDNCEQVKDPVGELCTRLLADCPSIRVLATSRSPLGVRGETLRQVTPLPVPAPDADAEAIAASPSIHLLESRIADHHGTLDKDPDELRRAAELVRALDGLPLAIELAARYLRVAGLEEVVGRIRRGFSMEAAGVIPERHRSLQLALGWSYDLLDDAQAQLFAELSVFRGRFDTAALEAVCGGAPGADVLSPLVGLVEASLVVVEDAPAGRQYRLLETVREYAAEKLEPAELTVLGQHHASYFTELAGRAGDAWTTPDQEAFMRRIRDQTANLLAAADFLIERGDIEQAGVLVSGVTQYWFYAGLHTEAIRTMRRVAEAAGDEPLEPVRMVIGSLVPLLAWGGRIDEAKELAAQHQAILKRRAETVPGKPQQGLVGTIAWCEGDLGTVLPSLEERVEALGAAGHPMTPTLAASVAFCLTWMGRLDEAVAARQEAAQWIAGLEPADGEPLLHDVDAWIAFQSGDLDAAQQHWETALAGYRDLDLNLNTAEVTQLLGWVDLVNGDQESAEAKLNTAQRVITPLSMKPFEIRGYALLALAAGARNDIDRARVLVRGGMKTALASTNRLGQLLLAFAAATIAARTGDWQRAGALFGAVRRLLIVCSAALPQPLQSTMDRYMDDAASGGHDAEPIADIDGVEALLRDVAADAG